MSFAKKKCPKVETFYLFAGFRYILSLHGYSSCIHADKREQLFGLLITTQKTSRFFHQHDEWV